MSTHSTVKFYDEGSKKPLLSAYIQYDGYISGVGHDLARWLKDKKVINGIGSGQTMEAGFANGMGCLAAQYVASQKTAIGNFYLTTSDDTQEYDYKVRLEKDGQITIEVGSFKGTPDDLLLYEEA